MELGAKLDQHGKVAPIDCYVTFAKHWKHEHNEDAPTLGGG